MSEPNWIIVIILSGLFGYFVQYLVKFPSYLYRFIMPDDLKGNWYEYFYCETGNNHLLYTGSFFIKPGLIHTYKVIGKYDKMIYKGYGFIENNNLCINIFYADKISKETVNFRFKLPTATHRNQLIGLWLSYDFENRINSGVVTLSKTELNMSELIKTSKSVKITKTNIIIGK